MIVLLVDAATIWPSAVVIAQFRRPARLVAMTDLVWTPGFSTMVLLHGNDTLKSVCGSPCASV